jgi:uncharacterized protein
MNDVYYSRIIEPIVKKAAKQFPSLLLTGVRQSGKSTLLRHLFPDYQYVTLDETGLRATAKQDPDLFLSSFEPPLIIDEIQYAPELLSALKVRIDRARDKSGQYLLTGSQSFQMMEGVSETLAGRIAVFNLHPFSWKEFHEGIPDTPQLAKQLVRGFYPELQVNLSMDQELWFSSYVTTYLERDVRNIKQISDLAVFRTFITLLAVRAGRLLNLSEVAKECGITQPTAKAWLGILESTQLIYLLRPYHRNISKRVVKTPKIYFMDTGLLCYLLGIDTADRLMKVAEGGHLFENMVVAEAVKRAAALKGRTELWFYRTQSGVEVDLIVERRGRFYAYEIKFTETPRAAMASALRLFGKEIDCAVRAVLCLRKETLPLVKEICSVHWHKAFAWESE